MNVFVIKLKIIQLKFFCNEKLIAILIYFYN